MCAAAMYKQSYLNRGESFIHSSKSTVILAFSRVFPLQSASVNARGEMPLEPCDRMVSPDGQQPVALLLMAP